MPRKQPPPPTPLSEIPTLPLLYKLGHLQPAPSSSSASQHPPSQTINAKISLIRTDITTLSVSSIVNAANTSLLGGGGVDGAIHRAAGPDLLRECRLLNGCETGSAKITNAYELPCDKVIHAVGPVYWSAKRERKGLESELLAGCYRRSLELAVENECGRGGVAFSALSTGVYGYPSVEASVVACGVVRRVLEELEEQGKVEEIGRVVFCCFESKDERAYMETLPKFFPPTNNDLSTKDHETRAHEEELLAHMPNPPTSEPKDEDFPPQPEAKKQKISTEESEEAEADTEAEWESIEKPEDSVENGMPLVDVDNIETAENEKVGAEVESLDDDGETKEHALSALHVAQGGGDPPQNALLKDW